MGRVFSKLSLFERLAEKVCQMNRSAKGLLIVTTYVLLWMVLVWQIADDSPDLPNLPNFPPTKLSRYTVCTYDHF